MKKRVLAAMLLAASLMLFAGCGGNVRHVNVEPWESELYTEQEVNAAVSCVKSYFKKEFSGCTLTSITYAGDEKTEEERQYAQMPDGEDVIVLTSSFDVDSSGGDGSLEPNSTYRKFLWILKRTNGGPWEHTDHGY